MNDTSHYLPPQALNDWLAAATDELGIDAASVDIALALNVAKEVAHNVARPAAPLSTLLIGLAAAGADDPEQAIAEYSERLIQLAHTWEPTK